MNADILRLFGIALIGIFASLILKERYKGIGIAVSVIAATLISISVIEGPWTSLFETVNSLAESSDFSQYAVILLKALVIGYMTVLMEGICNEAGEGTLAFGVELAGRSQIVLLSLPLLTSFMDIAKELQ